MVTGMEQDTVKCHPGGAMLAKATLLRRGDILLSLMTCKVAIYYITPKVFNGTISNCL